MTAGDRDDRSTAVVTGAAGTLGRSITAALLRDGLRVAVVDRDTERLHALQAALDDVGNDPRILPMSCDVTDENAVAKVIARVVDAWGTLDVLVNNAGIEPPTGLETMDMDIWDRTFAVNVRAPMLFVKHCVPHWRRQASGTMVSIGSRTWLSGSSAPAYAASKAALIGLTRAVAVELGSIGVTANVVAPSFLRTPLNAEKGDDAYFESYAARFVELSALRRLIEPQDVANAVAFLVSPAARNITGEIVNVAAGSHFPPAVR